MISNFLTINKVTDTVYEYTIYDGDKQFVETVHMTELNFSVYFRNHESGMFYKKQEITE